MGKKEKRELISRIGREEYNKRIALLNKLNIKENDTFYMCYLTSSIYLHMSIEK